MQIVLSLITDVKKFKNNGSPFVDSEGLLSLLRAPVAHYVLSISCLISLIVGCGQNRRSETTPASTSAAAKSDQPPPPRPEFSDEPPAASALEAAGWLSVSQIEPELERHQRAIGELVATGDARFGWLLLDGWRINLNNPLGDHYAESFGELTGATAANGFANWKTASDLMITWDLPAPPGYASTKKSMLEQIEPRWQKLFRNNEGETNEGENGAIDWRLVSWGGVLMDTRSMAEMEFRGGLDIIRALDDPQVTTAKEGSWYPDDGVVFAIVINGEARAYPKNVMEIHELVNDELGGRRIALPYCTLCGSAQLFFTDQVSSPASEQFTELVNGDYDHYEMRTSGLLKRSNKIMFEFFTSSMFDTFTGRAISGPLRKQNVVLPQGTVTTTSWGEWKVAYPETTILAREFPWGGDYPVDPLRGRDDNGPIFPVGLPDNRLAIQEPVLGVILTDGTALAFPVEMAKQTLENGGQVELEDTQIKRHAGGLVAQTKLGDAIPCHQAFWFAWSQFHPQTRVWGSTRETP